MEPTPPAAAAQPQPPRPPERKAPSRLLWFALGALAGAGGFFAYEQAQRVLVTSMMRGLGVAHAAGVPGAEAPAASLDAQAASLMQQAQLALQQAQLAAGQAQGGAPASSLDLVSGPGGGAAPRMPLAPSLPGQPAMAPQQSAQQGANMLATLLPMLSNPALTRSMTPQQRQQLQSLTGTLSQLQGSLQAGKAPTPADQQAMMRQLQQLMRPSVGSPRQAGSGDPAPAGAPSGETAR